MGAIRDWRREEAEEIYREQKRELDHLREWLDCIKYDYYLERKRRELRVLALEMGVRCQMAMLAVLERAEFNPAQPRVPAGNPDGGQWTSGDGGDESAPRAIPVGDGRGLPINPFGGGGQGWTYDRAPCCKA